MKLSRQKLIVAAVAGAVLIIAGVVYVAWYTYHRHAALAQIAECNYEFAHPTPPTLIPGPGGMMVSATLAKMCPMVVVPPALGDLIRGHIVFSDLSPSTKVNPYSLVDILLGRYTLGPNNNMPCNQSATTTDCSTLPLLAPPIPQSYVPSNVVQPDAEWTSATGTSVFVSVGDILGAMTVVSVTPFNTGQYSSNPKMMQLGPQNIRVNLKGPIEVTGAYSAVHSGIGFDGYCMSVSEAASLSRLPVLPAGVRSYFCFHNGETAQQKLGEKSRTITVMIDNYQLNSYPSEVVDWADLISVVRE